eukprot:ANDGO_02887.mRNA.1 hypothetical protein
MNDLPVNCVQRIIEFSSFEDHVVLRQLNSAWAYVVKHYFFPKIGMQYCKPLNQQSKDTGSEFSMDAIHSETFSRLSRMYPESLTFSGPMQDGDSVLSNLPILCETLSDLAQTVGIINSSGNSGRVDILLSTSFFLDVINSVTEPEQFESIVLSRHVMESHELSEIFQSLRAGDEDRVPESPQSRATRNEGDRIFSSLVPVILMKVFTVLCSLNEKVDVHLHVEAEGMGWASSLSQDDPLLARRVKSDVNCVCCVSMHVHLGHRSLLVMQYWSVVSRQILQYVKSQVDYLFLEFADMFLPRSYDWVEMITFFRAQGVRVSFGASSELMANDFAPLEKIWKSRSSTFNPQTLVMFKLWRERMVVISSLLLDRLPVPIRAGGVLDLAFDDFLPTAEQVRTVSVHGGVLLSDAISTIVDCGRSIQNLQVGSVHRHGLKLVQFESLRSLEFAWAPPVLDRKHDALLLQLVLDRLPLLERLRVNLCTPARRDDAVAVWHTDADRDPSLADSFRSPTLRIENTRFLNKIVVDADDAYQRYGRCALERPLCWILLDHSSARSLELVSASYCFVCDTTAATDILTNRKFSSISSMESDFVADSLDVLGHPSLSNLIVATVQRRSLSVRALQDVAVSLTILHEFPGTTVCRINEVGLQSTFRIVVPSVTEHPSLSPASPFTSSGGAKKSTMHTNDAKELHCSVALHDAVSRDHPVLLRIDPILDREDGAVMKSAHSWATQSIVVHIPESFEDTAIAGDQMMIDLSDFKDLVQARFVDSPSGFGGYMQPPKQAVSRARVSSELVFHIRCPSLQSVILDTERTMSVDPTSFPNLRSISFFDRAKLSVEKRVVTAAEWIAHGYAKTFPNLQHISCPETVLFHRVYLHLRSDQQLLIRKRRIMTEI